MGAAPDDEVRDLLSGIGKEGCKSACVLSLKYMSTYECTCTYWYTRAAQVLLGHGAPRRLTIVVMQRRTELRRAVWRTTLELESEKHHLAWPRAASSALPFPHVLKDR
jgi:hypothetical protein